MARAVDYRDYLDMHCRAREGDLFNRALQH
jgi:hypothetical protein